MRVSVGGRRKEIRALWFDGKALRMIDQTRLPHKLQFASCRTAESVAEAIRTMKVRGAPALGVASAYGFAMGLMEYRGRDRNGIGRHAEKIREMLLKTRPTAVNIRNGLERVWGACMKHDDYEGVKKIAFEEAEKIDRENLEACRRIGENGAHLIEDGTNVLTHCNTGGLACVDYGTAFAVLRQAHREGKKFFVYAGETRPRLQGALTAWELAGEGIDFAVVVDSARGELMRRGKVDLVIVGADRIARNGDFANKIGTYELAVVAKENGVPFYVAAPMSTFDERLESGGSIEIEFRAQEEVLEVGGRPVYPKGTRAINPAFDVTPAKFVSGYITENGIIKK